MPRMSEQANSLTGYTKLRISTLLAVLVAAGLATGVAASGASAQDQNARERGLRDVGFTARATKGEGQFVTEQQIAQQQPAQMTDLFTNIRGIRVDYSSGYPLLTASNTPTGGCVTYTLDGAQISMDNPETLNNFLHPGDVVAIEVYTPQQAPDQFRSRSYPQCEVIVIWTRKKIGG